MTWEYVMSSVYIYYCLYTVAQIKEIIFCHISSFLHIATHDNLFGVYKNVAIFQK